jgi:hypothetical protein
MRAVKIQVQKAHFEYEGDKKKGGHPFLGVRVGRVLLFTDGEKEN